MVRTSAAGGTLGGGVSAGVSVATVGESLIVENSRILLDFDSVLNIKCKKNPINVFLGINLGNDKEV
jgi:hypothetical protein